MGKVNLLLRPIWVIFQKDTFFKFMVMHMRTTGFISFELFHLGSNEIKNSERYLNKIKVMFAEGK